MNIQEIILHLSLIKNVGSATIERIIQSLSNYNKVPLTSLYTLSVQDIKHYIGVTDKLANIIKNGLADKSILENELSLISKHNINLITIFDSEYPELLKSIYLPPSVLYIRGSTNLSSKSIAVVGSRNPDFYGNLIIKKILPTLIEHNWTIVSGGARGIDTLAHKITLQNNGNTIAVLGSGLLKPYPKENTKLFEQIINSNGSIVSSFPLNYEAFPGNFPARNRIIAGLSKACVVVQAAQASGALITAQFALEQSREVCAIPGPIDNPLSAGCHKLISEGAHLVTSAQDIQIILNDKSYFKKSKENNIKSEDVMLETSEDLMIETNEQKILFYCSQPISFDELILKTEISSKDLQDLLWDLELKGKISQNFMGLWTRI